ncbi:MAG: hypothetical protein FJ288_08700 [Planctomycetes bacterium]|nr:hypothetical protein [Planctomycetota bacterium]
MMRPGRRCACPAVAAIAALVLGLPAWTAETPARPAAPAKPDAAESPAGPAPPAAPAARPVTTVRSPAGDLVRKWWAEGTAAGNDGDFYDNRDRGHSNLALDPYPQLQKVQYNDEDRKRNLDWGLQGRVLRHVVFGNSSTSAGPTAGGSNARLAYSHPMGLAMLYAQYTNSNLYIYPEHQDHDPGRNGSPGHGDLFPTNTPCLIISQGSSGSDRPFMQAMPLVLAAFRPEVKRKLIEAGMLAPTIQMILRRTGRPVASDDDYLSGKAHPTVFEGSFLNDLEMVKMAHAITLADIPPMVQLAVTEEGSAVRGRDYFDPHESERLGTTPAVVARVFRGRHEAHRMVVSAEGSRDLGGRPLRYRWVLLRGDAARVRIRTLNEAGSRCEIAVPWHERRPAAPGSAIESSRIDIGIFVHNGAYWSAPGFVTVLCPDHEARTYEADGRCVDIGYGAGTVEAAVAGWATVLDFYKSGAAAPAARLLGAGLAPEALAAVAQAAGEYRPAKADADAAQDALKRADEEAKRAKQEKNAPPDASKAADARLAEARKAADAAKKAADEVLSRRREPLKGSVRDLVEGTLKRLAASPTFWPDHFKDVIAPAAADAGKRSALETSRQRLVAFGLLKDGPLESWDLTPVRAGAGTAAERLTASERVLLAQFAAEVLSRIFTPAAATVSYKRNYVDPRISVAKSWRDVFRYGPTGECIGWTRYDGSARTEFNAWGLVVLEKDSLGRCLKAQEVRYELAGTGKGPGLSGATMKWTLAPGITQYEYAGPDDRRGRVK